MKTMFEGSWATFHSSKFPEATGSHQATCRQFSTYGHSFINCYPCLKLVIATPLWSLSKYGHLAAHLHLQPQGTSIPSPAYLPNSMPFWQPCTVALDSGTAGTGTKVENQGLQQSQPTATHRPLLQPKCLHCH